MSGIITSLYIVSADKMQTFHRPVSRLCKNFTEKGAVAAMPQQPLAVWKFN
jgi:hypothetical protein